MTVVRESAHVDAVRADISTVAARLQEVLGQRLTAYAVRTKDPRAIGKWARGEQEPHPDTAQRLRNVYEVTQVLASRESAETIRAWMLGAHPLLGDRAPLELLHEDDPSPVERTASSDARSGYVSVVNAADAFVQHA